MRRRASVLVAALLVLIAACGSSHARRSLPPIDNVALRIVQDVDSLRLSRGLAAVQLDSVSCNWTALSVRDSIESSGMAFFDREDLHSVLCSFVPDLEKRCFLALSASGADLPVALRDVPGYMEAALDPQFSHVAVAAGPSADGRVWGSVCLMHRLVQLGPCIGTAGSDGPSSVTVQGTTRFAEVMLQGHRTDDGAIGDSAESPSIVVPSDESGAFSGTLWFPNRGPAFYDVIVLVRGHPDDEFRPAAKVRHFAPKPKEHDCRPSVVPFEGAGVTRPD